MFSSTFRIVFFSSIVFFFIFNACTNNTQKDCTFGSPTPMFAAQYPGISNYSFQVDGQRSSERVHFDSLFFFLDDNNQPFLYIPIQLEVLQRGCDTLFQEFRFRFIDGQLGKFRLPQSLSAPDLMEVMAQRVFGDISNLHPNLLPFQDFAGPLYQKRSTFNYGHYTDIGMGYEAKIEKEHSPEATTVILLFQKKSD